MWHRVGESAGLVLLLSGELTRVQGASGTHVDQHKHDSWCSVIVRTGCMLQDPPAGSSLWRSHPSKYKQPFSCRLPALPALNMLPHVKKIIWPDVLLPPLPCTVACSTFSSNAQKCGVPASFRGFQADLVATVIPSLACGPIQGVTGTNDTAYLVDAEVYQGAIRPSQEDGTDHYSHDDCTRATVRLTKGFGEVVVPAPSSLPEDRTFVKRLQMIIQLLDQRHGYGY